MVARKTFNLPPVVTRVLFMASISVAGVGRVELFGMLTGSLAGNCILHLHRGMFIN